MERDDFFYDGMDEKVNRFEQMLASGENFFFDTDELEEIIEYYLDFNQIQQAQKAVDYGLVYFPFEIFYQLKLAEINLVNREISKAIAIMEKAKEKEPNNSEVAKLLGDAYAASLQYKKAIDCYQFALQKQTNKDDVLIRLARVHFLLNNPKKALNHLHNISSDYYQDEFGVNETIKMFFDFNELDACIQFLNKLIDQNPYYYFAWYYLGLTYQKLELHEQAINAFEYCTAIDDTNSLGYLGVGNGLMENKEYEKAIENFELALDNQISDAEILCNIAECYENLENYSSAKYYYLKAIKKDKYLSDGFFGLGMVYKKLNQLRDAEKNLVKAIALDQFESIFHIELAELYLLLDKEEECIAHYSKAIEIDPDTPEIILDFAQAYFEFNIIEKSILLLKNAIADGKDDHRILYRLASYLFYAGHFETGYNYLHAALQSNAIEYFLLYEYAPFLENNETVLNIIDLYIPKTE